MQYSIETAQLERTTTDQTRYSFQRENLTVNVNAYNNKYNSLTSDIPHNVTNQGHPAECLVSVSDTVEQGCLKPDILRRKLNYSTSTSTVKQLSWEATMSNPQVRTVDVVLL
jgi:hypothetical protein